MTKSRFEKQQQQKYFFDYPFLNAYAIQNGIEILLRLWYVGINFFANSDSQSGYLKKSELDQFRRLITNSEGCPISKSHFYDLLHNGNTMFWSKFMKNRRIQLIRFHPPHKVAYVLQSMPDSGKLAVPDPFIERDRGPFHSSYEDLSSLKKFVIHILRSYLFSIDLKIFKSMKEEIKYNKNLHRMNNQKKFLFQKFIKPRQISIRRLGNLINRTPSSVVEYISGGVPATQIIRTHPREVVRVKTEWRAKELCERLNSVPDRVVGYRFHQNGDSYSVLEQKPYKYKITFKQFLEKDLALPGFMSKGLRRYRKKFRKISSGSQSLKGLP